MDRSSLIDSLDDLTIERHCLSTEGPRDLEEDASENDDAEVVDADDVDVSTVADGENDSTRDVNNTVEDSNDELDCVGVVSSVADGDGNSTGDTDD